MGHKWGNYGAKIETACLWMARKVLILLGSVLQNAVNTGLGNKFGACGIRSTEP